MLEVKGLSKIYKTKKGADVKALDDVSLVFPEKGMVFLLGKSGSGKSTMLNVCGGLDAPTSGEILVKGRSSKDFSQRDFDSYRNTYIGFIFQEYNILNEFSVEDNIALALELQGKPKDKKVIHELLKQVDLEGYARRKPNTLSGGQKQRIAIARALVKSPEIIMADEPSGALDSATGKQVFETLKKLSQDKLVLVVSHDREFAEQYGDRIIELQDGKVISDITKTQQKKQELSNNINTIGDVLCVKKGSELTEEDFKAIKTYLMNSQNDILIASNEKDVKAFKKVSRITDAGEKEVFLDTKADDIEKKSYTKEDSKFIRSKLPIRHAVKIGLSSLRTKPVRLFFTILLCSIAFVLFGLLSTMSFYNSEATFKQTMLDSDRTFLRLGKEFKAIEQVYQDGEKSYQYDAIYDTRFSDKEVNSLKETYGENVFGGVDAFGLEYNVGNLISSYWIKDIGTVAYLPENHGLRGSINGTYPENKNEICISSYMADVIVNCKAYDENGSVYSVTDPDELLGKNLTINGTNYKIVGILDSGMLPEKFESLKTVEEENDQLVSELRMTLHDGLHLVAYVSYDRLQEFSKEFQPYMGEDLTNYRRIAISIKNKKAKYDFESASHVIYNTMTSIPEGQKIYYINGEQSVLQDNEVILSQRSFAQYAAMEYDRKANDAMEKEDFATSDKYNKIMELCYQVSDGGAWKHNKETDKTELIAFTPAELEQKIAELLAAMKKDGIKIKVGTKFIDEMNGTPYGEVKEFDAVGMIYQKNLDYQEDMIVSDNCMDTLWNEQKTNISYYTVLSTNYVKSVNDIYSTIFLPFDKSQAQVDRYWDMYQNNEFTDNDTRMKPIGMFVDNLEMIDDLVEGLKKVFLYIGIILAVFAALLLSNFISVSISQKKREIGILRAVGARSLDVFKIFFSESIFITGVCVVLATIGSVLGCNMLNLSVAAEIGASLFVFGIASFVVLILVALVTTVVATVLPVWNAARKKPVDSIRAL